MARQPKTLLISLRDASDPLAGQEADCFRDAAGLASLERLHFSQEPCEAQSLTAYDLLFVGGSGAYSVLDDNPWVRRFLDLLVEICALGIPTHASCFGYQGLALALGGEVVRDESRRELGVRELALTDDGRQDPLFRRLPDRFYAQLGHQDHVTRLPESVTELATGIECVHQAFKVKDAPFWATQFHPELNRDTTLERWLSYQQHYENDPQVSAEIRRDIETSPDTVETTKLLPALVRWVALKRWDNDPLEVP